MESPNCFTHLSENLPSWIVRVTDLAAHTASKHAEFSADYSRLSNTKPRRRKNSSLHSIRPGDNLSVADKSDTSDKMDLSTTSRQKEMPFDNPSRYIQAANRRRRGAPDGGTLKSGENSRISTRARHMVVVHYDSHTQNELDKLVKDIGAARNNLRKGRMARMRSNYGGFGMKLPMINTRNGLRKPPPPELDEGVPPTTGKEPPFDMTDKQLELAQNFCEVAAHQVLRDGDCATQLDSTRERLESVLELANAEAKRVAEEEKAKKERGETEEETPKKMDIEKIKPDESTKSPPSGITAIEVDDASSTSSISIDITAFRSTRFRV
jgi:hypothetical protein